jgi:hypothetical protein
MKYTATLLHTHRNLPFAEFLEWWANNCMFADDAISTSTYISKVSTYNSIRLHYYFATQDYILRSAQNCLAAHLVA